jgi:hypothetical protein
MVICEIKMPALSVFAPGRDDPPNERVTFCEAAKPVPIAVAVSPPSPESGVSISVALPVVCCAPPVEAEGVVVVDVPFVALVFMPVVAPLRLSTEVPVALPVVAPAVLDVPLDVPVLEPVAVLGVGVVVVVVVAVDASVPTANVPSIINLKESSPSIE